MTYGAGAMSWMRGRVYEQIMAALPGRRVVEFGDIEPNPRYETCMEVVRLARQEEVGYMLAVGGGSVSDGTKFIAAAVRYEGEDPWDIIVKRAPISSVVPHGCVTTLPATSSEANSTMVISREATREKLSRTDPLLYAEFAILDPETTYTLPDRQTANGIVDTYIHVLEQYLTYDVNASLHDRQAEGILLTLIEEAPKVRANPRDYDVRANIMWCASQGLNGLLRCGVPARADGAFWHRSRPEPGDRVSCRAAPSAPVEGAKADPVRAAGVGGAGAGRRGGDRRGDLENGDVFSRTRGAYHVGRLRAHADRLRGDRRTFSSARLEAG